MSWEDCGYRPGKINGPARCPRRCDGCDGEHHFIIDHAEGTRGMQEVPDLVFACKHCDTTAEMVEEDDRPTTEGLASQTQVRALLMKRQECLRKLAEFRTAIDAAADGRGHLPEPAVLRAMCAYVAADFSIFLDGTINESAGWVRTTERLPTQGQVVVAFSPKNLPHFAAGGEAVDRRAWLAIFRDGYFDNDDMSRRRGTDDVSHWMPVVPPST